MANKFETEIADFFKAVRCWDLNPNDIGKLVEKDWQGQWRQKKQVNKRCGDRVAFYRGPGVLIEAKETHSTNLRFDAVKPHQRDHLKSAAGLRDSFPGNSNGISIVAIKWYTKPKPRAFVVPIDHFLALERELHRTSIPLKDRDRPEQLVEVFRRRVRGERPGIPNPIVWDMRAYLDARVAQIAREILARPELGDVA